MLGYVVGTNFVYGNDAREGLFDDSAAEDDGLAALITFCPAAVAEVHL